MIITVDSMFILTKGTILLANTNVINPGYGSFGGQKYQINWRSLLGCHC